MRILVLSASVGAGHLRAAEAVELALRELAPAGSTIRNVDVLTLAGPLFRRVYAQAYLDLVNAAPHLLGYIYDLTDVSHDANPRKRDQFRRLVQRLNLRKFDALLNDGAESAGTRAKQAPPPAWDLVVNTHFLPAELIAGKRLRRTSVQRHITVVTDFDAHALWVNQPTDRYLVATPEAALSLRHWGVPGDTIEVTGIPVHPVFAKERSASGCRERHGLAADRPCVLLLAGGFGVGPIERMYDAILAMDRPVQVVAVTGKNSALKAKLERIKPPARHATKVLGFTTEMDELMAAADVVVTKPGGLTSSEVLARGAVMAIMNPIPGQESRNSDYLLEQGAAIKINSLAALSFKLSRLLADPARLAQLRAASRALGRPRAAYDVARRALAMAQGASTGTGVSGGAAEGSRS